MRERTKTNTDCKRLLDITELAQYIGMGKTYSRKWADEIGAVKHFGRRVLFDRNVIDSALDNDEM